MIKNVNGIEMEMTPEEEAEFIASLPSLPAAMPEPVVETPVTLQGVAAGLSAMGFTSKQIDAFFSAAASR